MANDLQRLGRRVADLEALVSDLLHSTNLGHSAIEGGAIEQYDNDGNLGSVIGQQPDGTNGAVIVNGPKPPTPSLPVVTAVVGGLSIRWDGYWKPGTVPPEQLGAAPLDFSHVEIHVSTEGSPLHFLADTALTLKDVIKTSRGGEILVPAPPEPHYVRFRAWSLAGKRGDASDVGGPVTPLKVRQEDLGFDLADLGGNTIYRGPDAPDGQLMYGDLWLKTSTDPEQPQNVAHRWEPPDPGHWEVVEDSRVVEAINVAFEAQTAAENAGLAAADAETLAGLAKGQAETAEQTAISAQDAAEAASAAAGLAQTTADSKVTVYRQESAPTGGTYRDNDLWIDTSAAGNNQLFAWSGSAWILAADQRIATALSTAQGKTTLFAQTSAPTLTGRTMGDVWLDTDDGNKRYVWTGAWTASAIGAAGISATARQLGAITIFKQTTQPASGMVTGDFWLDSDDGNKAYYYTGSIWELSQDAAINTAVTNAATAIATADGKARVFAQDSPPTGLGASDVGDVWIETDVGNKTYTWTGSIWQARQFGNAAIQPNSLVASDVIATGTITAALLQSIMVLASTIIAGDPDGSHVKIKSDGLFAYRDDPLDGVPNEAVRLGTASNDSLGITNQAGLIVAQVDDTGVYSGRGLNIREEPYFLGTGLLDLLGAASGSGNGNNMIPGATHTLGWVNSSINGITSEVGLTEVMVNVTTDRWYWVGFDVAYRRAEANEIVFRIRDGGSSGPTTSSPEIMRRYYSDAQAFATAQAFNMGIWYPTSSGNHRLLLTAATQAGGVTDVLDQPVYPAIICIDMGPRKPIAASLNRGTNTSAPMPQMQTIADLPAAGWQTFRGNGSQRTDANGPVQGYNPNAAADGDGKGYWWFDLPTINNTPDWAEITLYTPAWHYASGGTAILNLTSASGSSGSNLPELRSDLYVTGWSRGGTRSVRLPTSWLPYFRSSSSPRARGITVGPSGGTNPTYSGRFDGPSARLKIAFTQ